MERSSTGDDGDWIGRGATRGSAVNRKNLFFGHQKPGRVGPDRATRPGSVGENQTNLWPKFFVVSPGEEHFVSSTTSLYRARSRFVVN